MPTPREREIPSRNLSSSGFTVFPSRHLHEMRLEQEPISFTATTPESIPSSPSSLRLGILYYGGLQAEREELINISSLEQYPAVLAIAQERHPDFPIRYVRITNQEGGIEFESWVCLHCAQVLKRGSDSYIMGGQLCESCQREYIICVACCKVSPIGHTTPPRHELDKKLCQSCRQMYSHCNRCSGFHALADLCESGGVLFCRSCLDRVVRGYHSPRGKLIFLGRQNGGYPLPLYLGVELELQIPAQVRSCANAIIELSKRERIFILEHDSSIDSGFELITQPATLEYHHRYMPWRRILEIAREYGAEPEPITCGTHIHFNRKFIQQTGNENPELAKMLYIMEKYWGKWKKFSRRKGTRWMKYTNKYPDKAKEIGLHTVDRIKSEGQRYRCINVCKGDTIEFRLFNGVTDYEVLMAFIESVDFVVKLCARHSLKELSFMQWSKIMSEIDPERHGNFNKVLLDMALRKEVLPSV